jgi:hypothetical protein
MFQAVPPPIIRSSKCTYSFWYLSDLAATCHWEELKLYIQLLIFVRPSCYLPLRGAQTVHTASGICQTLLLPATERSSNCTYSFWYLSNCCKVDGRRNRLKHVERFIEINKLRDVAPCWLHFWNTLRIFKPNEWPGISWSLVRRFYVLRDRPSSSKRTGGPRWHSG